jgi:hypothetical protein
VLVQPFGATSALQPVLYVTPSPQSSVPKYSLPELPEIPGSPSQSSPETNEWAGTSPGAQLRGMHLGIGPPAASTFSVPGDTPRVPDASADRQQPYARSPQLSDRLTRIAYSRNMLSGRGIDVYLSNDIALLQGAVRTAGDRVLLANVLGLEPQVWQIANRLVVEQASASSSHLRNSLSTGTSFPEGISYER